MGENESTCPRVWNPKSHTRTIFIEVARSYGESRQCKVGLQTVINVTYSNRLRSRILLGISPKELSTSSRQKLESTLANSMNSWRRFIEFGRIRKPQADDKFLFTPVYLSFFIFFIRGSYTRILLGAFNSLCNTVGCLCGLSICSPKFMQPRWLSTTVSRVQIEVFYRKLLSG